jgi:ABC-type transport system involved in multi-copper enzyme maturation permease subunit
MTWVVWRQHRAEGLILLVVLAVIGVFLLITGLEMANSFQQLVLSNCLEPTSKSSSCAELFQAFNIVRGAPLLLVLPLLLGALVGAPLVTREVEQRTHLLIWTQSITRMRWLMVKLALVLGAGLLASGALLPLLTWWHSPWVQTYSSLGTYSPFSTHIYDTSGPSWVATALLALALGIFAGALTRRTVAAIFLTIVLFLAIRAPVELLWRPNFETPLTVTYAIDQQNPPALSSQDWQVDQGYIDAQGNKTHDLRENCTRDETLTQCLQANGLRTASGRSSGSRRASMWVSRCWRSSRRSGWCGG